MHWECRWRFPCHRLQRRPLVSHPIMHRGTCVTHVPWCMSGSLTRGGGESAPGIPGACATRNFTYLVRSPLRTRLMGTKTGAYHRADSRLAPSQWETSLPSNTVSHWLDANLESALYQPCADEVGIKGYHVVCVTVITRACFSCTARCRYKYSAKYSQSASHSFPVTPVKASYGLSFLSSDSYGGFASDYSVVYSIRLYWATL